MIVELSVDRPIAALASPPGGAARGIVRISGTNVKPILSDWFEPDRADDWQATPFATAHSGKLSLSSAGRRSFVTAQVFYWPNRRSYTGQPLIELHVPGSPCILEAILGEVYRRGVHPARPGEFTLRAFLAGKLDLLQAEAVLGVINAQDHVELKTALAQLAGGVSGSLGRLRHDLLELLADLEAGLDFIEEDIEFVSRADVVERLHAARLVVGELMQQTSERMQSRVRPQVVLAGLPNAGKSTLFNRIAGANTALVSPEQGTTRDFLIRPVEWDGLSFDLIDTAGWEISTTGISAAAQQQRSEQLHRADLLVWCTAANISKRDFDLDDELFHQAQREAPATIRLRTKVDLFSESSISSRGDSPDLRRADQVEDAIGVSVISDTGIATFGTKLRQHLVRDRSGTGQWLGMTAARCKETLELISSGLTRVEQSARNELIGDELIAVDIRDALDQLGSILGLIYTDDILDRVFSKFCIGK